MMKLMTAEIRKKMPAFGVTDGTPPLERQVVAKFFAPWTDWTWYAVEGEEDEYGGTVFFGLVVGDFIEWGYFSLRELESVEGPCGIRIERDMYGGEQTMGEHARYNKRLADFFESEFLG